MYLFLHENVKIIHIYVNFAANHVKTANQVENQIKNNYYKNGENNQKTKEENPMPRLEQNRVFHKGALNELKQQSTALMECASDVTEGIREILLELRAAADAVPEEAKDPGLPAAINALLAGLSTESYDHMKSSLSAVLDKLMENIPLYDRLSAGVLKDLGLAAGAVSLMIGDLMSLIDEGSLRLSQEDFLGRLNECESRWEAGLLRLEKQMELAMTYLKGYTDKCLYSTDPVNLSTGNFYYDKEDLTLRGMLPLSLHRYYNALDNQKGSLGYGWSHSYEIHLEKKADGKESRLVLHSADGREATFQKEADGIYRDIHTGREEILVKEGKEEPEGESGAALVYLYTDAEKKTHEFCADGKLITITDQNGNAVLLSYTEDGKLCKAEEETAGGHPAAESSAAGLIRSFHFCYDKEGYLRTVTDHTGRSMEYFCADGTLSEVTDAEGNRVCYRYGENGKIRAIKNARGILSVRNEYDEKNRIVKQYFPDGTEMSYTYEDGARKIVLRERNQSPIIYEHDDRMRTKRTIYHNGEESDIYNDRDQKTSHTDRNGNTTRYAYDNQGNIAQVIDALGEKTNLTYDAKGNLLSVKINGVTKVKNSYDKAGNLIRTEDALFRVRKIRYNERGQAEAIEQADGSVLYLSYDKKGNLSCIKDPHGSQTGYVYDALNRVVQTIDGLGNRTSYAYNRRDLLIEETNAEGKSRKYTYNESGKVTRVEDYDGYTTETTYNRLNKPESVQDKEGRKVRITYDAMWNVAGETLPTGAEIRYLYGADNRLTETRVYESGGAEGKTGEAEGKDRKAVSTIRNSYDKAGNLVLTESGAEGEVLTRTAYTYDALNRRTSVTDAEGNTTRYAYDAEGRLSAIIDPNGNRYTNEYNEAGELIKETDPNGTSVCYTYNALGKRASIIDALGQKTTYHYEAGGRIQRICYPDAREVQYRYDANGNLIEQKQTIRGKTGAEGTEGNTAGETAGEETSILSYTYDCMNRVTMVKSNHGQETGYRYDAVGNVISVRDANGNTTEYTYTRGGKLSGVKDALGNRTEYGYDVLDQLISIDQYGEGEATIRHTDYLRNSLGQLLCVKDALGNEEHYTYDSLGRVLSKQDKDGYETTYRYTGTGEIKSIRYGDKREVELSYDALRKLTQVKDWLGTTNIENDLLGRPTKVKYPDGKEVHYQYGKTGERTSLTYPDGRNVSYGYDEKQRLSELKEGERIITYAYDEAGRLKNKHFPNGVETIYAYNKRGQLDSLTHRDAEGILDQYLYTYDQMGNKTTIKKQRRGLAEESGVYRYGYDALGRLERVEKEGEVLREYHYDAFGNRIRLLEGSQETTYTYNALNQLITKADIRNKEIRGETREETREETIIEETYRYDSRGNLEQILRDGTVKNQYHYGAFNRLEEAVNQRGERAYYHYNGLGHRVRKEKEITEEPVPFLPTEEPINPTEQLQHPNLNPTETIDYTIDLTRPYHNLLAKTENGQTQEYLWDRNAAGIMGDSPETGRYYLQDELGSPIRLTDEAGSLTESYGYDEFGQPLYDDQLLYNNRDSLQPFGYTGYQYDGIAGTYYAQAREYRPMEGRFSAKDVIKGSLTAPLTLNRYGYCWGNPVNLTDRNGKMPEEKNCEVYYLNNTDGARIFGHSALLIVASDGSSDFYSFTGTGALSSAIKGNDISARLISVELNPTETDNFLDTGDINIKIDKGYNFDNYDRALKKQISEQEREILNKEAQDYTNAMYSLYTYNCDTVAGLIISKIDEEFLDCQKGMLNLLPNNSFYVRKELLNNEWESVEIGDVDLKEKLLSIPGAYYYLYAELKKISEKECGLE